MYDAIKAEVSVRVYSIHRHQCYQLSIMDVHIARSHRGKGASCARCMLSCELQAKPQHQHLWSRGAYRQSFLHHLHPRSRGTQEASYVWSIQPSCCIFAILATNPVDSPNVNAAPQRAGIAMIFMTSIFLSLSFGPVSRVLASEVFYEHPFDWNKCLCKLGFQYDDRTGTYISARGR